MTLPNKDNLVHLGMPWPLVTELENQIPGIAGTNAMSSSTSFIPGSAGTGAASTIQASGNINRQSSVAGIGNGADTTEDVLFTYTLPANAFDGSVREAVIEAFGSLAANAHTKTIRMYFGTGVVMTLAAATIASSSWNMQLSVYNGTAATGTQIAQGQSILGATHQGVTSIISGTEPTGAGIVIKVTGQSGAGAAGGEVSANGFSVDFFN